MAAAGKLRTRLYVMASGLATMQALGKPESGLGGGLLAVRAVKLYADGALGSRGAALLEPYADDAGNLGPAADASRGDPGGRALRARPRLPGRRSTPSATGPTAWCSTSTRRRSPSCPGLKDPRFRVEHAQILDAADIPRFGKLGVIASMQGIHAPPTGPGRRSASATRACSEGAYVWRKLSTAGRGS